jgi:hypothetical protein
MVLAVKPLCKALGITIVRKMLMVRRGMKVRGFLMFAGAKI